MQKELDDYEHSRQNQFFGKLRVYDVQEGPSDVHEEATTGMKVMPFYAEAPANQQTREDEASQTKQEESDEGLDISVEGDENTADSAKDDSGEKEIEETIAKKRSIDEEGLPGLDDVAQDSEDEK